MLKRILLLLLLIFVIGGFAETLAQTTFIVVIVWEGPILPGEVDQVEITVLDINGDPIESRDADYVDTDGDRSYFKLAWPSLNFFCN